MKVAFMALVAVLILGAGGGGAYFYFQTPAQASIGDSAEHQDTTKATKARLAKDTAVFVELTPLILPIIDNNGISQVVSMVVVLEVADEAAASRVRNIEPRLQDAYIQGLYGALNRHVALEGGVIKVDVIKQRLETISDRVAGDNVIENVLIQLVQQRPV